MAQPRETATTRKTTGSNDVPGQATKSPKNSYAYDNTKAPYANGQDVSGYVGVDECYRTYADGRNKPLNAAGSQVPYALQGADEDAQREEARVMGQSVDGHDDGTYAEENDDYETPKFEGPEAAEGDDDQAEVDSDERASELEELAEELDQREKDLDAREKAVEEREKATPKAPAPPQPGS